MELTRARSGRRKELGFTGAELRAMWIDMWKASPACRPRKKVGSRGRSPNSKSRADAQPEPVPSRYATLSSTAGACVLLPHSQLKVGPTSSSNGERRLFLHAVSALHLTTVSAVTIDLDVHRPLIQNVVGSSIPSFALHDASYKYAFSKPSPTPSLPQSVMSTTCIQC